MQKSHKPGFVVIEGLDGVGTTTQAQLLSKALQAYDLQVCLTFEPSDGPIGRLVRTHVRGEIPLSPISAALAFCADRADHLASTVGPALRAGTTVVCDRYLLSTLAYQGAGGVDRTWILEVSRNVLVPDLTVFLELDEPTRRLRLSGRDESDRWDDPALSESLRDSYRTSIGLLEAAGHRIEIVDAGAGVSEVHHRILNLV